MTYLRVLRRNELSEGGYEALPPFRFAHVGLDEEWCGFQDADGLRGAYRGLAAISQRAVYDARVRRNALLGDLRRLEKDARDELEICDRIVSKTGIDDDLVAAVLAEFIGM
jgi:hypothetical protein